MSMTFSASTKAVVLWLHPQGQSAQDLQLSLMPLVQRLDDLGVASVFVEAPTRLQPSGKLLSNRAWYGYTAEEYFQKDKVDLIESMMYLDKVVSEVEAQLPLGAKQIYLAGREQGAFLAIEAACCLQKSFAGAIAMTGDWPLALSSRASFASNFPVLLAELPTEDDYRRHRELKVIEQLEQMGLPVEASTGRFACRYGEEGLMERVRIFIETHLNPFDWLSEAPVGVPYSLSTHIAEER